MSETAKQDAFDRLVELISEAHSKGCGDYPEFQYLDCCRHNRTLDFAMGETDIRFSISVEVENHDD